MKRVALATSAEFPDLTDDDRALLEPLKARNMEGFPLIWDDPESSPQNDPDLMIVRSCWNYHLNPAKFLDWARKIDRLKIPLWNPLHAIEWNIDKHYLKELLARGIPVVPTVWLKQNQNASLNQILNSKRWESAVVKPAISATSFRTWTVSQATAEEHQPEFESMLAESGVLVQKLLPEIQNNGEWSLIFFDKLYSHAVLKRARPGEFRVQEEFGGTIEALTPPASFHEQAQSWLKWLHFDVLYTRVDAVEVEGRLQLMELELIEPGLFLKSDGKAAETFAEAMAHRLC